MRLNTLNEHDLLISDLLVLMSDDKLVQKIDVNSNQVHFIQIVITDHQILIFNDRFPFGKMCLELVGLLDLFDNPVIRL